MICGVCLSVHHIIRANNKYPWLDNRERLLMRVKGMWLID